MIPVAFGRCAGWLHDGGSRRAVLMCGAQGFEGLCAAQGWRVLADMIAAHGFLVLRFDCPGSGDALDLAPGENATDAALAAIAEAERWLRTEQGAESVSVVALRLGALLALEALKDAEIDAVALLAPVMRGRAYVRETKAAATVVAQTQPGMDAVADVINFCGFRIENDDAARLSALSVSQLPAAARWLVVSDDASPEVFAALPAGPADTLPFPAYAEWIAPPTEAVTPFALFRDIAAWLGEAPPCAGARARPDEAQLRHPAFTETRFHFGPANTLAGILCVPAGGGDGLCVTLLNAGANAHTGWARMAVDQARLLAAEGIASFRIDLSGIGDSDWSEQGPRPLLYSRAHEKDVAAAIDALEARGMRRHIVAGLCAGGYLAFRAAAEDKRVAAAVCVNALRLHWSETEDLAEVMRLQVQSAAVYSGHLRSASSLRRVLTGQVPLAKLVKIAQVFAGRMARRACHAAGLDVAFAADSRAVRRDLRAIVQRGAAVTFVHAEHDQSGDEAERHFGAGMGYARKLPGVRIEHLAGADHVLNTRAARDRLLAILREAARRI